MKYKLLLLGCTLCLAAIGLFVSCITDSENVWDQSGSGQGKQDVLLQLRVPGSSTGKSKAGSRSVSTSEESLVKNLYILVFDTETQSFEYSAKAENVGEMKWTVKLEAPKDKHPQDFLLIANAEGTKADMLLETINDLQGTNHKDDVKKTLLVELTDEEKVSGFNAAADNNHAPFTMSGEILNTVISADEVNSLSADLYRVMARVQLYFGQEEETLGTGLDNFVPEAVILCNTSSKAQVFPNKFSEMGNEPSIPKENTLVEQINYTINGNKLENVIYVFETEQKDNVSDRPCLIIKGRYENNESTYYRIDLYDNDNNKYLDILRNHSYVITVMSVTEKGAVSFEEALESNGKNITAGLIMWNETEVGNIHFDGQHYLGISTMQYSVGKTGGIFTQKVKANVEWNAKLLDEVTQQAPTWVSITSGSSGTGNNATETLSFNVKELTETDSSPRTAILRFTAENLEVDAQIIQDKNYIGSGGVFIDVQETVVIKNENGETAQIQVVFGPANTDLIWTLNDESDGKGIVLASDQPMMGGMTGYLGTNTATILVNTNKLVDSNIITNVSQLKLSAQDKEGNSVSTIVRLLQSTFNVELSTNSLTAHGQDATLYVNANADWKATFDKAQNTKLPKFTNGFLQQEYSGVANAGLNNPASFIQFDMLAPEFNEGTVESKIRFVTDGGICEVGMSMSSVFTDDSLIPYEILKIENVSFKDAITGSGSAPADSRLVTRDEAKRIIKYNGGTTWISDPNFKINATCPSKFSSGSSVDLYCVSLKAAGISDGSPLQAEYLDGEGSKWKEVGTIKLEHRGRWNWYQSGDVCHIVCSYKSYNPTSKEISFSTHGFALNPTVWTATNDHWLSVETSAGLTETKVPLLFDGSHEYEINNAKNMPSSKHNAIAQDYLISEITGEETNQCYFLRVLTDE